MKLAFSTLGCPGWDIKRVAEKALEYGFDGVELRVQGRQHVDIDMSKNERQFVQKLFEEKNLAICCLSSYAIIGDTENNDTEGSMKYLQSLIELAIDLKSPAVRIFAEKHELLTLDDAIKNVADDLIKCSEYAAKKGITILIETHHGFKSGYKMSGILKRVQDHDEIAVLWDVHHTVSEGESPEETYRLLGSKIKHIHLKDAIHIDGGSDKICLLGKGNLPIQSVISMLKENRYKEFLCLEWEKMWIKDLEEPEIAFPQFIEYIHGLL